MVQIKKTWKLIVSCDPGCDEEFAEESLCCEGHHSHYPHNVNEAADSVLELY